MRSSSSAVPEIARGAGSLDSGEHGVCGRRVAEAGDEPVERDTEDASELGSSLRFNSRTSPAFDERRVPCRQAGEPVNLSCREVAESSRLTKPVAEVVAVHDNQRSRDNVSCQRAIVRN